MSTALSPSLEDSLARGAVDFASESPTEPEPQFREYNPARPGAGRRRPGKPSRAEAPACAEPAAEFLCLQSDLAAFVQSGPVPVELACKDLKIKLKAFYNRQSLQTSNGMLTLVVTGEASVSLALDIAVDYFISVPEGRFKAVFVAEVSLGLHTQLLSFMVAAAAHEQSPS